MPTHQVENLMLTPAVWAVGKWPEGMAFDGQSLWVAESGQRTLARLDPFSGAVIERVPSGRLPVGMVANRQTGEVFAEVATDQTIVKFSRSGKGGKFVSLPDYPNGIAADDVAIWTLLWVDGSNADVSVIRHDQRTGASKKSEILGQAGSKIAKAGNSLWVNQAMQYNTDLNLLDPGTLQRKQVVTLDGFFPAMAATETGVFLGGGNWDVNGTVIRVDPATLFETARRELPGEFIDRITTDGEFVVAAGTKGTLWVMEAGYLALRREIRLNYGEFTPASLLIEGDTLYISVHTGSGENGSILELKGWMPAPGHP